MTHKSSALRKLCTTWHIFAETSERGAALGTYSQNTLEVMHSLARIHWVLRIYSERQAKLFYWWHGIRMMVHKSRQMPLSINVLHIVSYVLRIWLLYMNEIIDFMFFSSFFFFRKNYLLLSWATSVRPSVVPSVRPSVVCGNIFFRGNLLSNRPIDLKIGLNVREGVVHVRKAWFLFYLFDFVLFASCKFMQFANFCK